jgi:hypothetical protein
MSPRTSSILAVLGAAALAFEAGCTTDAFCYSDCPGATVAATTTTTHTTSGAGGGLFDGGTGQGGGDCFPNCGKDAGGACSPTNGGVEACDGVDNDCNGKVDDGIDFASPDHCGTCAVDCYALAENCAVDAIACKPPAKAGEKGACQCAKCDTGWVDRDGDGVTCEYACDKTANDDSLCNLVDDDCDGLVDEDVDFCSVENCGGCNAKCVVAHGTAACVPVDPQKGCKAAGNTECKLDKCDCKGPGECFWHLDGDPPDTCNYQCDPTNGGVEICDGLDNDCDGKIDAADDLSKDPAIGVTCQGGPKGECAAAAHAGKTVCDGGVPKCTGPDVLLPGQVLETCNGKDDDCDGLVDDDPVDQGGACGKSANAPCTKGTLQCQAGALACVGNVDPAPFETCNGVDDDCNGLVDDAPADASGDCEVPAAPPQGALSACKKGTKSCLGGLVVCQGAVKAVPGAVDGCGVDANCDGLLTSQPDLTTDAANCGACGHDCNAGAVHASFACQGGVCAFAGCEPGYYDLDHDQKCEYPCTFLHAEESCNGLDDNCDGQVDENVPAPSPVQVCGVSPSATAPECQAGAVAVACVKGAWVCTFPQGVCDPTCAKAVEVCDALDNDCDGVVNENVANYGKPCASDDGKAPPGDGACRTTGTFVCNGPNATKCSAVKADCANLPGGCVEVCDGVDNDCDGSVDEPYTAKGSNATYYVKPAVVRIGGGATGPWIFAYEASRPSATGATAGAGNGFFTVAPANTTPDKTIACSKPGVVPWSSVTPREVEQSCAAIGGRACTLSDWQRTCRVNNADGAGPNTPDTDNACTYGYDPLGACTQGADYAGKTRVCNLGGFDFDPNTPGDQDGLLVTKSPLLSHCRAIWDGYDGVATQSAWDVTGNLREASRCQKDRAVCGVDATLCAARCCSGTSTVAGATRLCGTLANTRRLAGQACTVGTDCCDTDAACANAGACIADPSGGLYCANTPAPAKSCRAVGVACSLSTQCCGGEPCTNGVCGGAETLPGAIYPLMGGSFVTGVETGAACSFDFYKVDGTFKLYDTGFRCCFDAAPN